MLVRVPIYSAAVTGDDTGSSVDLSTHSGTFQGMTLRVADRVAGTFGATLQTSPDGATWFDLQAITGIVADSLSFDIPDTPATSVPADCFRYVRADVTGAATPNATVTVELILGHQ